MAPRAAVRQDPVSAQVVGNAFVQQYYNKLHQSPGLVHKFYQDISKLGRPEEDGSMSITTTMDAINTKILSCKYDEFRAEIKSADAQESLNGGVHVLVTGCLTGKDNIPRNFTQSFFLAPQHKGYFVLNDMFRYMENASYHEGNRALPEDNEAPITPEEVIQVQPEVVQVQENHIPEKGAVLDDHIRLVHPRHEFLSIPLDQTKHLHRLSRCNDLMNQANVLPNVGECEMVRPFKAYKKMYYIVESFQVDFMSIVVKQMLTFDEKERNFFYRLLFNCLFDFYQIRLKVFESPMVSISKSFIIKSPPLNVFSASLSNQQKNDTDTEKAESVEPHNVQGVQPDYLYQLEQVDNRVEEVHMELGELRQEFKSFSQEFTSFSQRVDHHLTQQERMLEEMKQIIMKQERTTPRPFMDFNNIPYTSFKF